MSDDALEAGQIFGVYVIQRRLGAGTYGAVYEALRQPLKKRVALKVLHASQVQIPEAVQRFLLEARAAAKFDHPNIAEVLDLGDVDGRPFIAMELLDGETLAQRLKRVGRMSPSQTVDLLLPVFAAVVAVHREGIVHRDLKPSNIFLARDRAGHECVKLLDFGIAKVDDADHSMTRTGAMMGSPHYMSPEQAHESRDVDARADQWALGVMLYECLAGRRPFTGGSLVEVLSGVARDRPPSLPSDLNAPVLERVIFQALEKKREDRHTSVREMGAALLPLARESVRLSCEKDLGTAPPQALAAAARPAAPPAATDRAPADDPQGSLPVVSREIAGATPPATASRRRQTLAAASVLALISLVVFAGRRGASSVSTTSPRTVVVDRAHPSSPPGEPHPVAPPPASPLAGGAPPPPAPAPAPASPPARIAARAETPLAAPPRANSPARVGPNARTPAPRVQRAARRHREPTFTSTGIQIH